MSWGRNNRPSVRGTVPFYRKREPRSGLPAQAQPTSVRHCHYGRTSHSSKELHQIHKTQRKRDRLWLGNGLSYAQPSTKGRGSAAVKAGSHSLRVLIVIPVTRFAIGSLLPEQSLSPLRSGTGGTWVAVDSA